jgi:membrane protein implicated in regulation of membrane protease activity
MLVIAHFGHWAVSLIYLVPFAVVALWLVRDRLRHGGADAPDEPGDER